MTLVVFENARLFDGYANELTEPACVVVEGGIIREISTTPVAFAAAVRIDCARQTLMPGLIDAHFHAYLPSADMDAIDRMPRSLLSQYGAAALRGALRRGFTTVRDACGADYGLVMALERGLIEGPRLLISGKGISQTGEHGDGRAAQREEPCGCAYCGTLSVIADGVDEVRKAVREELRKGASQIKIFASGGVTSPTDPIWMRQFTRAEIVAAVEEAATRRTYVMAHCHTSESARVCVESGVRSIEHGSELGCCDGPADCRARMLRRADARRRRSGTRAWRCGGGNPLAQIDLLADPDANISLIMAGGNIVRSSLDATRP